MNDIRDRLEETLLDYCNDDAGSIYSISGLDGFIHALACSPEVVMPSRWMPLIWGKGYSPEWETLKEAETFLADLMAFYNHVHQQLGQGVCEPVYLVRKSRNTFVTLPELWCEGFRRGLGLWGTYIKKLEAHPMVLGTILVFTREPDEESQPIDTMSSEQKQGLMAQIPPSVLKIREVLGLDGRRQPTYSSTGYQPAIKTVMGSKVGRNDPCPCGSGKKYKRCCGAI